MSAVHGENRAEVFKRWDELAPLNYNAWTEKEIIESNKCFYRTSEISFV